MYEQVAHALLNKILDDLKPEILRQDLRHFYTRLGANFYAMHSLFHYLYGQRADFAVQMTRLVEVLASRYIERHPELEAVDKAREADHAWFLSQEWVGMALYVDGFAGTLDGFVERLPYLQELGVNAVHLMPMLQCPAGAGDGGYSVSDFRAIDPRVGDLDDLRKVATTLRKRGMLLALDVVVNHTSNEHEWARRARAGEADYQAYYYTFADRDVPDMFEATMPEIFPETAPGNFTFDDQMGRWVMTVFNEFQWDLDYSNPAVFIEMIDIILFWANQGADIVRLDAVAFLWKAIGTTCQNLREAHLLLQLFKDCCQVTAPGLIFIAEAIVAPVEIIKYFGEDAVVAKECEIAYNATFMALLWDAVATHNAKLLNMGIRSIPNKLDRATWLNYLRCHDDIGLGFDDADIAACDYDPSSHRRFLVSYFTGQFEESHARGMTFGHNRRTGDARISGSLASLVGLEWAVESGDEVAIDLCIDRIVQLHAVILAFGGIPLLYYGDEIGTFNDYSFRDNPEKAADSRWLHRPRINWERADRRSQRGSVEQRIYDRLRNLIAVRKSTRAFADYNNRELLDLNNDYLFGFLRTHPEGADDSVLVVANFDARPRYLDLDTLGNRLLRSHGALRDLASGKTPARFKDQLVIPPHGFYWLSDHRPVATAGINGLT